jgi:hypothetical protein
MNFRTKLLSAGKTATGIEVPARIVEALGAGKRAPVRVTINGYTYRSTLAVMGGRSMVGVSAEVRAAAKIAGGDTIDVTIELDGAPREVTVPPELAQALAKDREARRLFDGLSYSKKRLLTVPIERAKTEHTRQRNLEKALKALDEGK